MGNQASLSERCLAACNSNKPAELKHIIKLISKDTNEGKLSVLETKDKDGQSCLFLCASKGHQECALTLLNNGVDVMTRMSDGGTALHAAVARQDEKMVELLLLHGADPFAANNKGVSPYQLVLLSCNTKIARRLERKAHFAGEADVRVTSMAGFSSSYKTRYLVVAPLRSQASAGGQIEGLLDDANRHLYMFSDRDSASSKCCLYLRGASVFRAGDAEAILRLSHGHQPITDSSLFTRKADGCTCVILKSSSKGQLRPPVSGQGISQAASNDQAAWMELLRSCHLDVRTVLPNTNAFLGSGKAGSEIKAGSLKPPVGSSAPPPAAATAAGVITLNPRSSADAGTQQYPGATMLLPGGAAGAQYNAPQAVQPPPADQNRSNSSHYGHYMYPSMPAHPHTSNSTYPYPAASWSGQPYPHSFPATQAPPYNTPSHPQYPQLHIGMLYMTNNLPSSASSATSQLPPQTVVQSAPAAAHGSTSSTAYYSADQQAPAPPLTWQPLQNNGGSGFIDAASSTTGGISTAPRHTHPFLPPHGDLHNNQGSHPLPGAAERTVARIPSASAASRTPPLIPTSPLTAHLRASTAQQQQRSIASAASQEGTTQQEGSQLAGGVDKQTSPLATQRQQLELKVSRHAEVQRQIQGPLSDRQSFPNASKETPSAPPLQYNPTPSGPSWIPQTCIRDEGPNDHPPPSSSTLGHPSDLNNFIDPVGGSTSSASQHYNPFAPSFPEPVKERPAPSAPPLAAPSAVSSSAAEASASGPSWHEAVAQVAFDYNNAAGNAFNASRHDNNRSRRDDYLDPSETFDTRHDGENWCVICLSAPPKAGFLHSGTVHKCVCKDCSTHIKVGDGCPVCRQPVQGILEVY
ncbi:hypothetical protein CEUSTIGMA_g6791.t1 [Chlamydomonas eustigma]|uniref:Uncharacterized protein n=1 Tax=Chlamydomonas eustigma TaxID=1157962 RepID=A0A250X8V2_9CHLO|nr:hypothetical protein CEUSTIGMA_g6791.t1 [Chlamydomonas eustigma]|eukprot:GAX79349.1 hypothetical protein CEUSTIGMA_g6791.t1 [Chlamydomonas eustigma]